MASGHNEDDKLKGFLKGSAILVFSNLCLKAVNFFLLPLYTANLTPGMLGVSDSITTFTGLVFPVLVLGLDSAYSAFYFDEGDGGGPDRVYSTLSLAFAALGVTPFLLFPLSGAISDLLFGTAGYSILVKVACATMALNLWYLPFALELRLKNRMFAFGLSNVVASLLMVALNVLFVVVLQFGEASLIVSALIVNVEQLLFLAAAVRKMPNRKLASRKLLRRMLAFSLPLVPMTVMSWVLTLSDRYLLLLFMGDEAVGVYGIGVRVAGVLNVVVSAVQMAYTTFAFSSKGDESAKRRYKYIFTIEALILLLVSFGVSLFGRELIDLMADGAYAQSSTTIRDLMFAQSLYAMTAIVGYGIFFKKKSIYSLLSVSTGALVNLLLNILLIPFVGLAGAAFATIIGNAVYFALTYVYSERFYPCDYGVTRVIAYGVVLYAAAFLFANCSIVTKLIICLVALLIGGIVFRTILRASIGFFARMRQ